MGIYGFIREINVVDIVRPLSPGKFLELFKDTFPLFKHNLLKFVHYFFLSMKAQTVVAEERIANTVCHQEVSLKNT